MVDFGLWSSNRGIFYKGNDEVLKEMLSKIFKTLVFVLAIS